MFLSLNFLQDYLPHCTMGIRSGQVIAGHTVAKEDGRKPIGNRADMSKTGGLTPSALALRYFALGGNVPFVLTPILDRL